MKLLKCYIENFGKLHKFEYEFKDGLNIINEQNGFGKTTFATFIKSMFYGLDAGTNVKTENSERKKYYPWQGGIYGGNIEFEINNKQYRIERFFGKKQSEDTFNLYDLKTNLESKDYTENIGEEIFKINKSGYERSTYIPQGQIKTEMEDSLNAKLSNVLEGENDINSSEDAIKKINESKKVYIKDRGTGGLIDNKKNKLNSLEAEIENIEFDEKNLEKINNKIEEIKTEIKIQEAKKEELQKQLTDKIEFDRKTAKKETYNTIVNNYTQLEKNVNSLNNYINNKIPDGIEELDKKIEISQKQKAEETNKIKFNKKISILFIILSILFIVLGIIFLLNNIKNIIGITSIFLAIIFIVISFIKYKNLNNNKLSEITKNIQDMINTKETVLEQISLYDSVSKQLNGALKEKEKFEKENNIEDLIQKTSNNSKSENELKQDISLNENEIEALINHREQLKNQKEILENKIDDNTFLEEEIDNLKQEIKIMNEKYNILNKTEELLKKAKETFSASYLNNMFEDFNKYLKMLNKNEIQNDVDIKLNVNIDVNGAKRDVKFFSAGYKDLIYICMRLSLINALFKEEKPFIVLDDPFVNLDEEKTREALNFIKEVSKQYQIIYFVCNSNRT